MREVRHNRGKEGGAQVNLYPGGSGSDLLCSQSKLPLLGQSSDVSPGGSGPGSGLAEQINRGGVFTPATPTPSHGFKKDTHTCNYMPTLKRATP